MRPRHAVVAMLMTVALAAALSGCASDEEILPPLVIHTPLEIDPLNPVTITEWWASDRSLLRLRPDGGYEIYPDGNRYRDPTERGRWSQQSYAWIRLEPYTRLHSDARRLSFARIGNDVALVPPAGSPLVSLARPPAVLEDRVVGWWSGAVGELVLRSNGSYRYYPMPDEFGQPARVAGHQGRWRIDGDRLLFRPDPLGMSAFEMLIEHDEGSCVIRSPEGPLERTDGGAAPP